MDNQEFDMMLFLFLYFEKSKQNVKKERRIYLRKIFVKHLFLCKFCQAEKGIS